jgi:hypothetical protein
MLRSRIGVPLAIAIPTSIDRHKLLPAGRQVLFTITALTGGIDAALLGTQRAVSARLFLRFCGVALIFQRSAILLRTSAFRDARRQLLRDETLYRIFLLVYIRGRMIPPEI